MTAIERFNKWIEDELLAKHDALNRGPLCPFAGQAIKKGKVQIEEFVYTCESLTPILDRVRWLADTPLLDVLVLIHPGVPCDAETHRELENALREPALRLGQHTFSYHVDDPTRVADIEFKMPVCGLQFQPESLVQASRQKLLKGRYYDKWTVDQMKDIGFFSDR